MRTKHILYGVVIAAIALGCRRKNEYIAPAAPIVAGKGGNAKLWVTAKHFQKEVDTGTVYIKYNATGMPTDMKFDDTANIKNQNGRFMVVFDSLKRGNYYLYIKGRDLTIDKTYGFDSLWGGGRFVVVDTIAQKHDVYINVINQYDSWSVGPTK